MSADHSPEAAGRKPEFITVGEGARARVGRAERVPFQGQRAQTHAARTHQQFCKRCGAACVHMAARSSERAPPSVAGEQPRGRPS